MTCPSKRPFRDVNEQDYFQERLAEIVNDGRLDDVEAERSAWSSVLLRRQRNDGIDRPTPELLTVEQFAEYLQVSRTTVFYWLKNGDLREGVHYFRIGRVLRFRWQEGLFFNNQQPKRKAKTKAADSPPPKKRPRDTKRLHAPSSPPVNLDY
jgi:excisionase family DNA binding protein